MKVIDFSVYDDHDNLIETLPAILYVEGNVVVAQVPNIKTSVDFIEVETGMIIETVTVENGKAMFDYSQLEYGMYIIRVGSSTITGLNQITLNKTTARTLDQVRNAKMDELNKACNKEIMSGFFSSALGSSHFYSFDNDAQVNFSGTLNAINASLITEPIEWSADGAPQNHTFAQFKTVYMDGYNHKLTLQQKYWNLKQQVLASSIDQVNQIKWS